MSRNHYDVRTGVTKIGLSLKSKVAAAGAAIGVLGMGIIIPLAANAAPTPTQVVVTPSTATSQGWSTADTRPGGAVNFIADTTAPGAPKKGALQLTTTSSVDSKAQYMHAADTPLSAVSELSYSTKQNSASIPEGAASYQLVVNLDGTAANFTTLVYEPYWNGAVTPGNWQDWAVSSGNFWSSKTRNVSDTCKTVNGAGGPPLYTLAELKAACPNAVVVGFGVNIGANNPSYNVETDLVNFNGTTYNFEPDATVTVTVDKYVNGAKATAVTANSASFPMQSTWNSTNLGSGSGTYALSTSGYNSPNAYEAITSDMVAGASYATNEVLGGTVVNSTCTGSNQFALVGYTTGDTLAAAQAGTPSSSSPSFTNLQANKYVIVWNKTCSSPTTKDQCKNDGWKSFDPTFKNQGDCVSFVATKGKNQPNGVN